jgi:hypothetical protein
MTTTFPWPVPPNDEAAPARHDHESVAPRLLRRTLDGQPVTTAASRGDTFGVVPDGCAGLGDGERAGDFGGPARHVDSQ